jgi:hypothetical protein
MIKRLFWLTVGFGLGAASILRLQRMLSDSLERYLPPPVADRLRLVNAALDERAAQIRRRRVRRVDTQPGRASA